MAGASAKVSAVSKLLEVLGKKCLARIVITGGRVIFDIGEKVSSGSNKGQVLLLSCLTFGLITVKESIYKHMDGQITVDLLVGVLQGKVKVPQTTSI